ncbi:MAG: hypothetical protein A2Y75_01530 [Candidatus Solincola sediminis]|uniref:Uncharacterized protein n=1 Tax=Candidatus Solincola sediminis TaxID=1797199 RepID=A0A1F2WNH7_9ACTN|nr:MAG: hypothetical protein A2Y75_01530 [Candidatus Solincola sediminis]
MSPTLSLHDLEHGIERRIVESTTIDISVGVGREVAIEEIVGGRYRVLVGISFDGLLGCWIQTMRVHASISDARNDAREHIAAAQHSAIEALSSLAGLGVSA